MSDFTQDDLVEATERAVQTLLASTRVTAPPVDAVRLIQAGFGYRILEDDSGDGEPKQYGDKPKLRARRGELVFTPAHNATQRQSLAARACAKELAGSVLQSLGIVQGTEQRGAANQLAAFIAPRLMLPTKWFTTAARKSNSDLLRLREQFPTVAYEWIAGRLLDLEDFCVIAVVDDGTVSSRKSNFMQATKKLTAAEERCAQLVQEREDPQTVRADGWTSRGWPIPTGPFNRIVLRSTPDDVY